MTNEVEVYVGLGSNLGRPLEKLLAGLEGIRRIKGYRDTGVSSPYVTSPVGPQDQPPFVNAVARGIFSGDARLLLKQLFLVENEQGRRRLQRWGPRTLDLDLLLFGDHLIDEPGLTVPHPEMYRRVFVLAPLSELAPDLVLPRWGKTAARLLAEMDEGERESQKAKRIEWGSGI